MFVDELNATTSYPYKEYYGTLFGSIYHEVYIEYANSQISFQIIEEDGFACLYLNIKDYKDVGLCSIILDSPGITTLYQKIFGDDLMKVKNNETLDINYDWLE